MARYIDADNLKKEYAELLDCDFYHPRYEDTLRDIIDNAPTEDVVEREKIIKVLEQEPCEDAVSRAEALKGYIEAKRADGVEICSEKVVPIEYINNLPSVTPARKQEPILDKIIAEIEQVKSIMNEEIINHDRKDLINFVNGLNQSLLIIYKYKAESEDN